MTTSDHAPAARPAHAAAVALYVGVAHRFRRDALVPVFSIAGRTLAEYVRSGWILVELAYALALFLFAFRYPFDAPFFFETANWGLGLLTICATLLLVARAMRSSVYMSAVERVSRRAYVAGVALAAAVVRLGVYLALLVLALLTHSFVNATGGALLAGSVGLIAASIVLAALALALSTEFAPRLVRLLFLAWLTAALYSYAGTGPLATLCFPLRLPLLPLFASYDIGATGTVGVAGLLALVLDVAYAVGLVALAAFWLGRREAAQTLLAGDDAKPASAPAPDTMARSVATTPSRASSQPTSFATRARRGLPPSRKRAGR
ncbi:MAG: hypothetical protein ACRDHP_20530 [Ktedonobacterales bacterium]